MTRKNNIYLKNNNLEMKELKANQVLKMYKIY